MRRLCIVALTVPAVISCAGEGEDLGRFTERTTLAEEAVASKVALSQVTAEGPGCPEGSWRKQVAEDGSITFELDRMEAPRDPAADCTITLKVDGEAGASYALPKFDYTLQSIAYASGSADFDFFAHWQGGSAIGTGLSSSSNEHFDGTSSREEWITSDWSPCSGAHELRIKTHLGLRRGTGSESVRLRKLRVANLLKRRCDELGHVEPAHASAGPLVPIKSVQTSGDGCPRGTAATIAPDGASAQIDLSKLEVVSDSTDTEWWKSCRIDFELGTPKGQRFTIESNQLAGRAFMPAGYEGTLRRALDGQSYYRTTVFRAPYDSSFALTDHYTDASPFAGVESPEVACGEQFVSLKLSAYIRGPLGQTGAPAKIALSKAGPITFSLRPCPAK